MLRDAISIQEVRTILQPAIDTPPSNEAIEWAFIIGVSLIILAITWSERRNK